MSGTAPIPSPLHPMKRTVAVLIVSLLAALRLGAATAPANRPNIVILYTDDMGYGDLAIQNPESKIRTPHLDRLAREGLRFTDAHSSSGICTPRRPRAIGRRAPAR